MKKIKNSIIAALLLTVGIAHAQQDPSFTLYKYNMNILNPAFAGTSDYTEVNLSFRSSGVTDGPQTQTLTFAKALNDKIGLGVSVVNDEVFVQKETDVTIDFSYKLQLSENDNLYLGLKAGGSFLNLDFESLGQPNDPLLSGNQSQFNPNVGIGAYFKGEKYYFTLSTPNLLNGKRYTVDGDVATEGKDQLHMYIGGGYTISFNENINFTPSLMTRLVSGAPSTVDLTGTVDLYKKVELGVLYRSNESISGFVLLKLIDFVDFGYGYDASTTDVNDQFKGSEFLVRLRF